MVGLDKALEGWLETVASIGDLTPAEQAKITTAGAKVFQKELEEVLMRVEKKTENIDSLMDDVIANFSSIRMAMEYMDLYDVYLNSPNV